MKLHRCNLCGFDCDNIQTVLIHVNAEPSSENNICLTEKRLCEKSGQFYFQKLYYRLNGSDVGNKRKLQYQDVCK